MDGFCVARESLHGLGEVVEDGGPFVEVLFASRGEAVEAPGRTCAAGFPLGFYVSVLLELAQDAVDGAFFDCSVGEGVLLEFGCEVVAGGSTVDFEQEQDQRLDEAIEITHGAGTGIIIAVAWAESSWHLTFSQRAAVPCGTYRYPNTEGGRRSH